ncbi:endonuclease/exonuclease/phosphatase family protein [Marivivens aquimaris]|uniref:endonuclease/exonuclease/phosphatase family protein n=1 Tax=Marivivens aquimaris TaxID=2774876 RepID=UPI0018820822|nr:endonuclease/exonuclease/phosphatase family protein [Marivivens aquimaris]
MARQAVRDGIVGALVLTEVVVVGLGAFARLVPSEVHTNSVLRVMDSLSLHLLIMGLLLVGVIAALGAIRVALAAGLVTLTALGFLLADQRQHSLPFVAAEGSVRVLWFNVLYDNVEKSAAIVDAIIEANPDLVVLGEAGALVADMDRLAANYDWITDCPDDHCEVVMLGRGESSAEEQRFGILRPGRYFTAELPVGGSMLTVVGAHFVKPWFDGLAGTEQWQLRNRVRKIEGPVLVVGDFNAAPWSNPVRWMMEGADLYSARVPVATWPVGAGALGVPIDQVFVGHGARLVSVEAFGDDLGSNHRGLLAEVTIPQ